MDKTKTRLANIFFILFYEHQGAPVKIAQTVGEAVREAIINLFPLGTHQDMWKFPRVIWGKQFINALISDLEKLRDEIDTIEDFKKEPEKPDKL
jgi:hypothetical protein